MLNRKKRLEELANEITDMDYSKFTEGEDYASLAKRYSTQGQKAMDDTIGKVAARTGGLASSYATAAGNQAYNDYMGKLEDAARGLYDSQRQEKMEQFNLQKALYDQDYREANDLYERSYRASRDNVSDNQWQQQFDRVGDQMKVEADDKTYNKTQKLIEGEELALEKEFYYNANAYPTYADYKAAFPGTLITEARFNQIKGIATGMYKEDNKADVDKKTTTEEANSKQEAENTIMMLLEDGKSLEDILAADSTLIQKSGHDMLYWTAYASLLEKEAAANGNTVLNMSGNDLLTQLESGNYSPAVLNTYEQTYGESYFNKIMRDKSYEKMDAQSIYALGEALTQMGREQEADTLAEMWDTYNRDNTYKEMMGPLTDRTWTLVDDGGKNHGGGINRNAKIRDQYGRTYTLGEFIDVLANNSFGGDRDKAKQWILEHQGEWGVTE
jgi:hypothetical protein